MTNERDGNNGPEKLIAEAIEAAEEYRDPLDKLAEEAATAPNVIFLDDTLKRLAELKKRDRGAYEALRAKLKKTGLRVTELDKAVAEQGDAQDKKKRTQADTLIDLAKSAELFHTNDTGYADIEVNGHRETWPVRSRVFKRWLAHLYFGTTESAPNSEAMQAALGIIEAKAGFDGPERPVHLRVGGHDGRIYIDLANEAWQAVEIDASGWRIVDRPPVRFRRAAGVKPLPVPVPGGSIERLRRFVNVKREADFVLLVSWLLAALRDRGPYPILVASGEQGAAKSTLMRILRALVDPNRVALRTLSREEQDLAIAAENNHLLAFDNLSGLPGWISDALCRLSTGGGFATRQLYTGREEELFDAMKPIILNGIEDVATQSDLADRSIVLTLELIREEDRKPEDKLWAEFEAERPLILGALLDAVSEGIRRLPEVRLPRLPRMADFALWATACETAIWPPGTFDAAYSGNRSEAVETVVESDPVSAAVRAFMVTRAEWVGTASDLLAALEADADDRTKKSKAWPGGSAALTRRLQRVVTFLRRLGIEIERDRKGRSGTRTTRIINTFFHAGPKDKGKTSSAASASSASTENLNDISSLPDFGMLTTPADADDTAADADDARVSGNGGIVSSKSLKFKGTADADAADADFATQAASEKKDGPRWRGRI